MKFITICDYTGIIECEIFAQTYRRFGPALRRKCERIQPLMIP